MPFTVNNCLALQFLQGDMCTYKVEFMACQISLSKSRLSPIKNLSPAPVKILVQLQQKEVKAASTPSGKLLCFDKPKKITQYMHGNILCMFDCWAEPVVHLLLLKSFMAKLFCWKGMQQSRLLVSNSTKKHHG